MEKVVIGLASDHAGYECKQEIEKMLKVQGYSVKDFGTYSAESSDYPEFGHLLAKSIEDGMCKLGFSFCGTGNGINMTVNKHAGIRSALCWRPDIASLARQHNDANICSIPARFVTIEEAKAIVTAFLSADFEGGRHERRIRKIPL
jgi:ribose 5-phosphate isomerase B